jgi:hypothetical protein
MHRRRGRGQGCRQSGKPVSAIDRARAEAGGSGLGGFRALRRWRSYSAVHDGPSTVDVLLELNNDELLITDDALDEIAD